ncbi:hypothetical protein MMC13_002010 [Lambiella insularis]|nr:hypothetical protein [Lambiella insularis]
MSDFERRLKITKAEKDELRKASEAELKDRGVILRVSESFDNTSADAITPAIHRITWQDADPTSPTFTQFSPSATTAPLPPLPGNSDLLHAAIQRRHLEHQREIDDQAAASLLSLEVMAGPVSEEALEALPAFYRERAVVAEKEAEIADEKRKIWEGGATALDEGINNIDPSL